MSFDLYPPCIYEGDLSADAFGSDVDEVCQEIRAAVKGWGCDEKRLLRVMGALTPEDRCKVPIRYRELFKKELVKVMKSECGNKDLGIGLQLLALNPVEADVFLIDKACKGLGTDERLLYSVLCGRSNRDIELLKKAYFKIHSKDLGQMLRGELSGKFENLILNALQASEETFDPEYHTEAKMKEDVERLYKMGQGKFFGTDEEALFKMFCAAPPQYLQWINLTYQEKYGCSLVKAMESEMSGYTEKGTVFLVGMKLKPFEECAKLIKAACRGMGTDELLLTSALIRYQLVMKQVFPAHEELFGKTVRDRVNSETSGNYFSLLMEIMETVENF